ncbi:MAG: phosphate acyltransferase PlsX [Oscillospiraceae bacterium]|nr:phosphate acyltransferase PlsX [Oscillospiraceae bacterium]
MRIAVDAMGGDNAPLEIIKGSFAAAAELGADVILVGAAEEILRCLEKMGVDNLPKGVEIANATQIITMEDDPAKAVREKKDSSMSVMLNMLRDGEADAAVSAGSTGALLSGATLTVKRIRGIRRAALAPIVPNEHGGFILVDSGANTECSAEYLVQFAFMGSVYAKCVLGCDKPRVALLNIGEEETKGTALRQETYQLLKTASERGKINFTGNIEARDVMLGKADVVVADGFSGNILLKAMEGMGLYIVGQLKKLFMKSLKNKLSALVLKKDIYAIKKAMDYEEVGGSIFLGITRPVIKAHGSSKANGIKSAIALAAKAASSEMVEEINASLEDISLLLTDAK